MKGKNSNKDHKHNVYCLDRTFTWSEIHSNTLKVNNTKKKTELMEQMAHRIEVGRVYQAYES